MSSSTYKSYSKHKITSKSSHISEMRLRAREYLIVGASRPAPGREGLLGAEEEAAGESGVEARGGERRRHWRWAGAMGDRILLGFWRETTWWDRKR
jgi:hypothetical protein